MAGEKLVRIKTEHKLSFKPHTESLCKKASQKLTALSRVAMYTQQLPVSY